VRQNARPLKCANDVDVCQHGDCFPFWSQILHLHDRHHRGCQRPIARVPPTSTTSSGGNVHVRFAMEWYNEAVIARAAGWPRRLAREVRDGVVQRGCDCIIVCRYQLPLASNPGCPSRAFSSATADTLCCTP
jgi:hypothetical protein